MKFIGLIGLGVTFLISLGLFLVLKVSLGLTLPFFLPWAAFLLLGMSSKKENKKTTL